MTNGIFLLLGGNLGDPKQTFNKAITYLESKDIKVVDSSSVYRTAAWGLKDQPDFLNQVIKVETSLEPHIILKAILAVEKELGRERLQKWGPRLIDIDLLYYNQETLTTSELTIPHPEIQNRMFTLAPIVEIAPDFIHPIMKKSQRELLALCKDPLPVQKDN